MPYKTVISHPLHVYLVQTAINFMQSALTLTPLYSTWMTHLTGKFLVMYNSLNCGSAVQVKYSEVNSKFMWWYYCRIISCVEKWNRAEGTPQVCSFPTVLIYVKHHSTRMCVYIYIYVNAYICMYLQYA